MSVVVQVRDLSDKEKHTLMQESFVANVCHEIRGPLASISSAAEALRDGMVPESDQSRYLSHVMAQVYRIQRMAADLLNLSRMDSERLLIESADIRLSEVLDNLTGTWLQVCEKKGIRLSIEATDLTFRVDPYRLEQILDNLLSNAVKFTPPNGTIALTTEHDEQTVNITVKDDGPGIEPENLSLIWERFFTEDRSRQDGGKNGVGLGLSIAKRLVERMGGTLSVDSAPGHGATFVCSLPLQGP